MVGFGGLAGMKLEDYAHRFPAIELQSTFCRLPRASTVERWKKTTLDPVLALLPFFELTRREWLPGSFESQEQHTA